MSIVILNISKGNVLKSCKLTYLFPSGRRTGRCSRGIGRSGSLEGPRCQTAGTATYSSSSLGGAPLLALLHAAVSEPSTASRINKPARLLRLLLPVRRVLWEDSPVPVNLPPIRSVSDLIRPPPRPTIFDQSLEIKMSKSISRSH